MKKNSIAIYARTSNSADTGANAHGIEAQLRRLRAAAQHDAQSQPLAEEARPVIMEYVDGGHAGEDLDRPALKRLLADCEAGIVNQLIVARIDRLSRRIGDIHLIMQACEQHGVAVRFLDERLDSRTPVGRAMFQMVRVMAEVYQ